MRLYTYTFDPVIQFLRTYPIDISQKMYQKEHKKTEKTGNSLSVQQWGSINYSTYL